jgi:hypothetical protein
VAATSARAAKRWRRWLRGRRGRRLGEELPVSIGEEARRRGSRRLPFPPRAGGSQSALCGRGRSCTLRSLPLDLSVAAGKAAGGLRHLRGRADLSRRTWRRGPSEQGRRRVQHPLIELLACSLRPQAQAPRTSHAPPSAAAPSCLASYATGSNSDES